MPEPKHSPRAVFVVCRRQANGHTAPAERINGRPVEHANPASARRAAATLGGPNAGVAVFMEWRDEHGNPCQGPYLRADPKGEGRT